MAIVATDIFELYQLLFGTTVIDGLRSQDISPGINRGPLPVAGSLWSNMNAVNFQDPGISFSTISVDKLLALGTDTFATSGMAFATGAPLTAWEAKIADRGGYASGNVHRKTVFSHGLAVLGGIQVAQDGIAVASAAARAAYDGTNAAMVVTEASALPAAAGEVNAFTLGPTLIEGVALKLDTGWQFSSGMNIATVRASGDLIARTIHLQKAQGMQFVISLETGRTLTEYGLTGAGITATVVFQLQKLSPTGTRVAAATAEHITLTVNHGTITPGPISGPMGRKTSTIVVEPLYDGTNLPVVVSTAAAIT